MYPLAWRPSVRRKLGSFIAVTLDNLQGHFVGLLILQSFYMPYLMQLLMPQTVSNYVCVVKS